MYQQLRAQCFAPPLTSWEDAGRIAKEMLHAGQRQIWAQQEWRKFLNDREMGFVNKRHEQPGGQGGGRAVGWMSDDDDSGDEGGRTFVVVFPPTPPR